MTTTARVEPVGGDGGGVGVGVGDNVSSLVRPHGGGAAVLCAFRFSKEKKNNDKKRCDDGRRRAHVRRTI